MIRSKRVQIVFILVFVLSAFVFGQDKQLREEILSIYNAKGEEGLRDFMKKQGAKISNKFIVDFANAGVRERKEEWLKISLLMAEEQKNKKNTADVYLRKSEYYRLISKYKDAIDCLEKAFAIYLKLNDTAGQGNVYQRKGKIFSTLGNNLKALEMYDKALFYLEKAKALIGQGNVFQGKGDIYSVLGNNSKALEMHDKALTFFKKAGDHIGQGNVYADKGRIYSATGNNSKALEMFNKALPFFKKTKSLLGQGGVYVSIGGIYSTIGDNLKALEMHDKALPFYEKARSPLGQGNVYLFKGVVCLRIGDNSKAFEMFDKALLFFEKAQSPISQGNVYLKKGDIYQNIGENPKALEMYDKALPFYKKEGYLVGQGNIYEGKGSIYLEIGNNSKAIEMYDKALTFFEKAGQPIGQGNAYWRKGDTYFYTGDNSRALEMYDKALPFFEKAGQAVGQGNVYWRKGDISLRTGNNLRALEMYNKALLFFNKARQPIGQGNVYNGIGNIFLYTGNYSKALEMYDRALLFFEKARHPIGQGNIYNRKGDIYLKTGNNLRALEMYDKALPFFEKAGQTIGQGNVRRRKGDIYLKIGNSLRALEMYAEALTFYEKARFPIGQGSVYRSKGELYLKIGSNLRALEMYNKSLSFYKKTGVIYSESFALHGKAKILAKLGKKDKALNFFEKRIANLEKVRMQTAFVEMKRTFMEEVYSQYEESVLFMLGNRYDDKTFKYAEAIKARGFLDKMAEGLVRLEKGLQPGLREERDRLVGKLSALSRQMQETGGIEEKKQQKLQREYRRVESRFEDLLIKIRLENPLYADVNYPQPISVKDFQIDILKKGETLISYFISLEKAFAFIVSKSNFNVKHLKVGKNEIKNLVDQYLPAIKENNANDMKRFGYRLYEKLFKPLEKYLDKNNEIIIVPMGELETIPFESLVVDKKKTERPVYLLEKYRVKYAQGATLLSILRKHYTRGNTSKGFIGFGDPVYDYENFKQSKPEQGSVTRDPGEENTVDNEIKEIHRDRYARAGGIMNRLPQSGEEIQTIARLFEKESLKSVIYLRDQATEANAKAADMKDFDYIHFSCHGLLNDDFQSLVLSQLPPDKSSEDGYFTLNEIMNCDYNAKLVVLSACETGKGKMYKGEGVTGLTRAVMYAGTPAVVASLWKVDDTATKELMVMFYRNMLEKNMDKVEALRQAKLELLKTQVFSSPYFWSAFILYGE